MPTTEIIGSRNGGEWGRRGLGTLKTGYAGNKELVDEDAGNWERWRLATLGTGILKAGKR
jgi:hypothetical protein